MNRRGLKRLSRADGLLLIYGDGLKTLPYPEDRIGREARLAVRLRYRQESELTATSRYHQTRLQNLWWGMAEVWVPSCSQYDEISLRVGLYWVCSSWQDWRRIVWRARSKVTLKSGTATFNWETYSRITGRAKHYSTKSSARYDQDQAPLHAPHRSWWMQNRGGGVGTAKSKGMGLKWPD